VFLFACVCACVCVRVRACVCHSALKKLCVVSWCVDVGKQMWVGVGKKD
jgi:hypothetical protein